MLKSLMIVGCATAAFFAAGCGAQVEERGPTDEAFEMPPEQKQSYEGQKDKMKEYQNMMKKQRKKVPFGGGPPRQ